MPFVLGMEGQSGYYAYELALAAHKVVAEVTPVQPGQQGEFHFYVKNLLTWAKSRGIISKTTLSLALALALSGAGWGSNGGHDERRGCTGWCLHQDGLPCGQ
jgi:hypothetical protein